MISKWIRGMPFLAIWMFVAIVAPAIAYQGPESTKVEQNLSEKDAELLSRSTNSIWYDPKSKKVSSSYPKQSVLDASDRHQAVAEPETPADPTPSSAFDAIGELFSLLFRSWQVILIGCLILLLVVVTYFVLKNTGVYVRRYEVRREERPRSKASIKDLPFELEQTNLGLLAQASLYRDQGEYSKAIVYLFSHVLVEMDHARCIRLARGKTNRTYIRELRGREKLRGFTTQIVSAFEYAFFGKHTLSKDAFEKIWQQLPAFESYLKMVENTDTVAAVIPVAGGAA